MFSKYPVELKRAFSGSARTTLGGEVRPQAADAATMESLGVWGIALTILSYIGYAVYKDLQLEWPTIQEIREQRSERNQTMNVTIEPHAEEVHPIEVGTKMEASQNVMFTDSHPGYAQEVMGDIDTIRDAPMLTDASLEEFFSRPIKIQSFDWTVGGNVFARFDPWSNFFNNPRVVNRIANYKLMRAKLHLKFVINGNAFHYGRVIASYTPMRVADTMTVNRAFIDADVIQASQKPHVYLDPTNSQGGEMCLPFFYDRNLIDITSASWNELGEIALHTIQALKHANGAADTVSIQVFAWATDVMFAIPTQKEPSSIVPQADEYGKKPVSRIAGAVANMAARLVDAPLIGPYARATEIGASAIGAMASLFGYSAPLMLESSVYRPVNVGNLAVTNMPSDAMKLAVDAKQELTIDPRTVGLSSKDEMTITSIAKRESFIANFPWTIGTPSETLLFNMVVDPCVHQKQGTELHLPACCFAALPFKYWRGTMKYRFQFVCSKYHKGRVKIVYDPTQTPFGGAEYNTAYTTVVDISDTTDFTLEVGWGQSTTYREHLPVGTDANSTRFDIARLTYDTSSISQVIGNGTISVYVVTELTVPNTVANNDIEVNMFVSAGDDFEVAVPFGANIEQLRVRTADSLFAPAAIEPHGGEMEQVMEESKPSDPATLNTVASKIPTVDGTNLVHFGEKISSIRQLLKRYDFHNTNGLNRSGTVTTGLRDHLQARSAMPYQPGIVPTPVSGGFVQSVNAGANAYMYGKMTHMNYFSVAYAGWRGSIRYILDFGDCVGSKKGGTVELSIIPESIGHQIADNTRESLSGSNNVGRAIVNSYRQHRPLNGGLVQNIETNPIVSFEIPYYSERRFTSPRRFETPQFGDTAQPGFAFRYSYHDFDEFLDAGITTYVAAGEDFSLFFFIGAPIFYVEPLIPT